jgi:hypothetical protein
MANPKLIKLESLGVGTQAQVCFKASGLLCIKD